MAGLAAGAVPKTGAGPGAGGRNLGQVPRVGVGGRYQRQESNQDIDKEVNVQ